MDLLDLSMGFVKKINSFLDLERAGRRAAEMARLVERISDVQALVSDANSRVSTIMKGLRNSGTEQGRVFCITKNRIPICIVGEKVAKPRISEVVAEETRCNHRVGFKWFEAFASVLYVETRSQLVSIDRGIRQAAIEVFSHTYRSYKGFTCFISVGDCRGHIYIIDAIKFRDVIPSLGFLKCGVPKIIHCNECARRLVMDFKDVGCLRRYRMSPREVFVDWRIRPVPGFLLDMLQEGVVKIGDCVNGGEETLEPCLGSDEESAELRRMASKYNISDDKDILSNLLRLRRFIARDSDESVYYVMTDRQLVELFNARPATQSEFSNTFKRTSPLARQHMMDFLLVFRKGRGDVALQKQTGRR